MTNTYQVSLMEKALGKQWDQLPASLQAHYQQSNNTDQGTLDIEYPRFMQLYLNAMRLLGVLVNRRGTAIPATVEKWMEGDVQQWKRSIYFPADESGKPPKTLFFKSHWVYASGNELIEYVNSFIGLRMAVTVQEKQLHYEGKSYVIKLGSFLLPVPEWLILGHTHIVETAISHEEFTMDFRLHHPWFGEVFCYSGAFTTKTSQKV